jgi:uncharacterized membrane protein
MFIKRLVAPLIVVFFFLSGMTVGGQSDGNAYAVLFFSPTCPHCHQLILEDLPPIRDQFGDKLTVFMVDVSTETGQMMAQSAYQYYSIPRENWVVPMMIVDEQVLIGGSEIPAKLPMIVRTGLANGGVPIPMFPLMQVAYADWLAQADADAVTEITPATLDETPITQTETAIVSIFERDPIASIITIAIWIGLMISGVGILVMRKRGFPLFIPQLMIVGISLLIFMLALTIVLSQTTDIFVLGIIGITFIGMILASGLAVFGERILPAITILTLVGLTLATYMAYIELTANPAVCGLIGDCNAVQQSDFAFIVGVPVGVIGVVGYVFMFVTVLGMMLLPTHYQARLVVVLQTLVVGAAVFTIYLTFLEPFVIGAVCAWCLLSSLVVLNLMWLVLPIINVDKKKQVPYLIYQPS